MARTRSQAAKSVEEKKPTKIKFDDADVSVGDEYHTAEESDEPVDKLADEPMEEEDEDEDDSDEAPEEESVSQAKNELLVKQKEEQKAIEAAKKAERERRKQRDLHNKQQQDLKKSKRLNDEDLPEFLPDDITNIISEKEEDTPLEKEAKHLKLDLDDEDESEIRRLVKERKLKKVRDLKKLTVKKGPVRVQVQNFNSRIASVPKASKNVVNSKEKWLKRKALAKK